MPSSGSRLLDELHDQILIVNKQGKVVYTNASARGDADGALSGLLVQADVRHAIDRLLHGRDSGPIQLKLRDAAGAERQLSVVNAPNGTDAAVIVHPLAAPVDAASVESRTVAELMRQHLQAPLQAFVERARKLPGQGAQRDAMASEAQLLAERMEKVIDLIGAFGGDAIGGDERLLPQQLIETAVQEGLSEQLRSRVSIALHGFDRTLPPIYGSRRWLQRALREIVENAAVHGKDAGKGQRVVEIRAMQAGAFLTLICRNGGAFCGAGKHDGRFLPYAANQRGSHAGSNRIGLSLAQRIVEMHGGTLKLRDDDDGTEVVVQLPTGAPRLLVSQVDADQARRYAQDLSILMAKRRHAHHDPQQHDSHRHEPQHHGHEHH